MEIDWLFRFKWNHFKQNSCVIYLSFRNFQWNAIGSGIFIHSIDNRQRLHYIFMMQFFMQLHYGLEKKNNKINNHIKCRLNQNTVNNTSEAVGAWSGDTLSIRYLFECPFIRVIRCMDPLMVTFGIDMMISYLKTHAAASSFGSPLKSNVRIINMDFQLLWWENPRDFHNFSVNKNGAFVSTTNLDYSK